MTTASQDRDRQVLVHDREQRVLVHDRDKQVHALQGAFAAFTQVSDRLTAAYHELEARVATLTAELSVAQSERFRHLAEQERLAHRLHALLNSLPAAVVVLDAAGSVQECNRTAQDWFGTDLLSRSWLEVAQARCVDLPSAGGEVQLRDGRWVSVADCALAPEPGRIFVFSDVTETRRLLADVERHRRLSSMGEMVATLAHQIRTPLATALLYASNLETAAHEPTKQSQFAAKVTRSLHHLERVVNDMLVFAKGGAVDDTPITVTQLINALAASVQHAATEQSATLVWPASLPDGVVRGSETALVGALENIVMNALQAGGVGVTVRVSAQVTGTEVVLSVSDDGPGMPDDIKERVFEPFFTTRGSGTGLGLAVARAIVLAHRGTIAVESQPAFGTTFVLRLPRYAQRGLLPSDGGRARVRVPAVGSSV